MVSVNKKSGQIRIIGGQWRGRKLRFPSVDGLRPTGDRNRETIFNWLQAEVVGSQALDLFAGSGALGLEALSRGAKSVQFCEMNKQAARQLADNLQLLGAATNSIYQGDAFRFLQSSNQKFDLVFIDPPFSKQLFERAMTAIAPHLNESALVYLEMPQRENREWLLDDWSIVKEKKMGDVVFFLVSRN